MPAEWYTVPPEYGGRTLSFRHRLFFEYLWRRHGSKGLYEYTTRRFNELALAMADAARKTIRAFEPLRESMKERKSRGTPHHPPASTAILSSGEEEAS